PTRCRLDQADPFAMDSLDRKVGSYLRQERILFLITQRVGPRRIDVVDVSIRLTLASSLPHRIHGDNDIVFFREQIVQNMLAKKNVSKGNDQIAIDSIAGLMQGKQFPSAFEI